MCRTALSFPLLLCTLLTGGALSAQAPKRAVLTAHVIDDSTGEPLPGAHVGVSGTTIGGFADASGVVKLTRIPPGRRILAVGMLGYHSEQILVDFEPGQDVQAEVRLPVEPLLISGLVASVDRSDRFLARRGVYDRARHGGTFLLGRKFEEVARRKTFLHELFWGVPGVAVALNRRGSGHVLISTRGTVSMSLRCTPRVLLDGFNTDYDYRPDDADIDQVVPPGRVAAIEVYAGPAEAPLEFGAVSPCGTVLIWTKHGR